MKPSINRAVHYVSYGTPGGEFSKTCRAAIITEVFSDTEVGLAVFNPTGLFFHASTLGEAADVGGTWHWPERVAD